MTKGRGLRSSRLLWLLLVSAVALLTVEALSPPSTTQAVSVSGDQTITALVLPMPPSIPAIIDTPANNSTVQQTPLVVSGTCQATLLVRIYNNGQLAGSSTCQPDGTFTINITLSVGSNVLTALNYDNSEQAGPASASVTITVIEPVPSSNAEQAAAQVLQTIGSDTTQPNIDLPKEEPIFQGTALGPLAKLLGIDRVVSAQLNRTIAIGLTLFTTSLAIIIAIALFAKRVIQLFIALLSRL